LDTAGRSLPPLPRRAVFARPVHYRWRSQQESRRLLTPPHPWSQGGAGQA